jgi:hypothetical protein
MKSWIKWTLLGFVIIILLILGFALPSLICPDFFRMGPAYPTDQPFCSWLIRNPLHTWIPWLIVTAIIGLIIGKIKAN